MFANEKYAPAGRAVLGTFAVLALVSLVASGCGWDPSRPFDRNAPAVSRALEDLDAGDASSAATRLEEYLSTGQCKEGVIGTPEFLRLRPSGAFDLGLALFRIGERFGRRFGEEEIDAGVDQASRSKRHSETECASRVVAAVAESLDTSPAFRARARYLQGNLAFLDGDYESAVRDYDRALVLSPGEADASDSIGRDAAWNRSIALRRIDDKKDAGSDSGPPDSGGDGASGQPDAAGSDSGGSKDSGGQPPKEAGDGRDSGEDSGSPPRTPDAGPEPREDASPPPPSVDQDDRMLDQLENAPTLQQEEAKRTAKRQVRGMADK
jgi:tetratricopeptide (TPR) repeat protein